MLPTKLANGLGAATILLLCVGSASATEQLSQEVSAQCTVPVNDLPYPPAAVAARIRGVVSATVVFDNQGAIASIDVNGYPLLASAVWTTLHSTPPITACAGQKIAMHFSFVLDDNLKPNTPASVTAASTADYRIVAPTPIIESTLSDPAWVFTRHGRFSHHLMLTLSKLKFW